MIDGCMSNHRFKEDAISITFTLTLMIPSRGDLDTNEKITSMIRKKMEEIWGYDMVKNWTIETRHPEKI